LLTRQAFLGRKAIGPIALVKISIVIFLAPEQLDMAPTALISIEP
jgi:hypothetical protein